MWGNWENKRPTGDISAVPLKFRKENYWILRGMFDLFLPVKVVKYVGAANN